MTIKKIKVKVSENIDILSLTNNTRGYHLSERFSRGIVRKADVFILTLV